MATHSSVLAWRIPGTGEPGGLPSVGSHRVGHNWSDLAAAAAAFLFSRGSSQLRDRTLVSCISGIFFTIWATRAVPYVFLPLGNWIHFIHYLSWITKLLTLVNFLTHLLDLLNIPLTLISGFTYMLVGSPCPPHDLCLVLTLCFRVILITSSCRLYNGPTGKNV